MTFCPLPPFSPNIITDLRVETCFQFMRDEYAAGILTAIIAGVTGYFVVLRRSAFVAHAFSEIGFAGAAGAVLYGIPPIAGLLLGSSLGALAIAALGRRAANRDTQIGIVLAFSLGLGLLFISLYSGGYAQEAYSILFGEIEGVSTSEVYLTLFACAGILAAISILYRPLLFASLDEDVAEAKGMPMFLLGTVFMLVVAVAVSFSVQVTGVLLIFSLMVTPAATAQYLSTKARWSIAISVGIALMATFVGVFVSFYTHPPVSFYITGIVFAVYLLVRVASWASTTRRRVPTTTTTKSQDPIPGDS
jgi:zinc/manganese transport system permease protein